MFSDNTNATGQAVSDDLLMNEPPNAENSPAAERYADAPITEGTPEYEQASEESESAGITDINEIDLATEALPEVDESKMEDRLEYAPHMQPGKSYNFIFALDKDKPTELVKRGEKNVGQVNYTLTEVRDDGSTGKVIKFLRADMYRTENMESSKMDELLFALGRLHDFQQTDRRFKSAVEILQEMDAQQKIVRGIVHWRRFDKETRETWSTAPQKPYTKKDGTKVVEKLWPKHGDGKFNNRPDGWEGNYGSETVTRVLPTKETAAEIKAARNGQAAA